jgi:ABC-type branched-subunit amino acid transport system ATPase component
MASDYRDGSEEMRQLRMGCLADAEGQTAPPILRNVPILQVQGVRRSYGGLVAVSDCTFNVEGRVTGLIGPNGAGKSTLVNIVSGTIRADQGSVVFNGTDITRYPSHRRARLGLARTFQLARQFQTLTALENVMVAAPDADVTLTGALCRRGRMKASERAIVETAMTVLADVGLESKCDEYAGNLSGGQMRLLELARVFIARPKLILLDEPMAGVSPALIEDITEQLLRLARTGVSIILVEHNLNIVENVCDQVIVMANGGVLAVGTMEEHRENASVVEAYLGAGHGG